MGPPFWWRCSWQPRQKLPWRIVGRRIVKSSLVKMIKSWERLETQHLHLLSGGLVYSQVVVQLAWTTRSYLDRAKIWTVCVGPLTLKMIVTYKSKSMVGGSLLVSMEFLSAYILSIHDECLRFFTWRGVEVDRHQCRSHCHRPQRTGEVANPRSRSST